MCVTGTEHKKSWGTIGGKNGKPWQSGKRLKP